MVTFFRLIHPPGNVDTPRLQQNVPFTPGDNRGWQNVRKVYKGGEYDTSHGEIAIWISQSGKELDPESRER